MGLYNKSAYTLEFTVVVVVVVVVEGTFFIKSGGLGPWRGGLSVNKIGKARTSEAEAWGELQ